MQPMRQGDVLLIPRTAAVQYHNKQDHLVLALGEATGHKHQISNGQAELYKNHDRMLYLRVISEFATLSHEEHHALQIPQGDWLVRIQREYEPTGWHPVAD